MLKKLFKQKTIPWIGGFKETFSQALWWGTPVNFAMMSATFYYTTLRYVLPWFNLSMFIGIVIVGAAIIFVVEYKWIVPSIWEFRSKQMEQGESQIIERLERIEKSIKELKCRK
jgi:hypothetical protein